MNLSTTVNVKTKEGTKDRLSVLAQDIIVSIANPHANNYYL